MSAGWRIAALAAAIGLVGWGAWTRVNTTGPTPAEQAVRDADPGVGSAAIQWAESSGFIDRAGYQRPRLKLWCGHVEGRSNGQVAVLLHYSRRGTLATIDDVALGWRAALTEDQSWLLARCRVPMP